MSRPTPTLQRLERLLAVVPWLLEHPGAEVREVAERFGADPREIIADLDTLGYCGLPGYGGGDLVEVSVVGERIVVRMADFFRRPLRLSVREAVTLLLAGRTFAEAVGAPEAAAVRSAVGKLERALSELQEVRVTVDLRAPGDEHLPALRAAVAQGRVVNLRYRSATKAETTVRDVEPWALVAAHGAWYLQAWCRLAQGPRDFRLDRIVALRTLDERRRGPRPGPRAPTYTPGPEDRRVVLDLDRPAWWLLDRVVADRLEEHDEVRRVEFRTAAFEWLARALLRAGRHARVVEPPELGERAARLARRAQERYGRTG